MTEGMVRPVHFRIKSNIMMNWWKNGGAPRYTHIIPKMQLNEVTVHVNSKYAAQYVHHFVYLDCDSYIFTTSKLKKTFFLFHNQMAKTQYLC